MPGRGTDVTTRSAAAAFVVNSLAAKAQSVAEIERKLAALGVSAGDTAVLIDDATRLGYLDDAELAGQLARGFVSRESAPSSTHLRSRPVGQIPCCPCHT